jgi:hypothetical protein
MAWSSSFRIHEFPGLFRRSGWIHRSNAGGLALVTKNFQVARIFRAVEYVLRV